MSLLASDYVGPVAGGSVVYVIVGDRAKFDQIARPVTEHPAGPAGRVWTKAIGDSACSEDGLVIFQHWPDSSISQGEKT
ncbi:hypothetical protein [Massilia sp. CFBP9026]|uniref:hypothetical protein n=1 Tax=Massilia sp. CFBP9026 TaxID=3096536 RepID=UPI002A6AFDDE|nr:hypothetical protein [Massilia sp. CFBP9026]MDY0965400.1 hypothetical protein [Massilia sp. CFBP9026]